MRELSAPRARGGRRPHAGHLFGHLRHRQAHVPGETRQYVGTPHEKELAYPLICGHENVGEVLETGGVVLDSEGAPLRPGDRIVPAANVPCGRCYYCLNGFPTTRASVSRTTATAWGASRPPHLFGGWSEAMVLLPRTPLFRVPDDLPSEVAVLTEEMSVTHGLATARVGRCGKGSAGHWRRVGRIIGVGPLGLCHLIRARLTGYGRDHRDRPARGPLACGAVARAQLTDQHARHRRGASARRGSVTHRRARAGRRVDCSGVPRTFGEALRMVRYGGTSSRPAPSSTWAASPSTRMRDICATRRHGARGRRRACQPVSADDAAADGKSGPAAAAAIDPHRMPLDHAREAIELSASDDRQGRVRTQRGTRWRRMTGGASPPQPPFSHDLLDRARAALPGAATGSVDHPLDRQAVREVGRGLLVPRDGADEPAGHVVLLAEDVLVRVLDCAAPGVREYAIEMTAVRESRARPPGCRRRAGHGSQSFVTCNVPALPCRSISWSWRSGSRLVRE